MAICYSCFRSLESEGLCPHCGFDNAQEREKRADYLLPLGVAIARGRYLIGQSLGQGGFGVTYAGYDYALKRKICVKEFLPAGFAVRNSSDSCEVFWSGGISREEIDAGKRSFVKEARKASRLSNLPSVVKVSDVFYENETAYIIMEFIEGVTLKQALKGGGMGERECFELLRPVMCDLEEIHRRGIIHRDISPDNLMRKPDGSVMLLDMGAAKELGRNGGQSSALVTKRGYSPLEQYVSKGKIGPWTDVYALCATYYFCVRGEEPPPSFERMNGEALELSGFSPRVAVVLEKGLAIKADRRIRSMRKLREAFEGALYHRVGASGYIMTGVLAAVLAGAVLFLWGAPRLSARKSALPPQKAAVEVLAPETTAPPTPEPTPEPLSAEELFAQGESLEAAQEYSAALDCYLEAGERGSAAALVRAGWLYYEGRGAAADTALARACWTRAAEAGESEAEYALGLLAYEAQDYESARQQYELAAGHGSVEAMNALGDMARSAQGFGGRDYELAAAWYTRAAEAGDSRAQYSLGELYERGYGVTKDAERALVLYQASAEAAYPPAMYWLAVACERGELVPQDSGQALDWYTRAAEAGHAGAMYQLGNWYYSGNHVPRNPAQAKTWWERAAQSDHAAAMRSLARLYETGDDGVEANQALAEYWSRRAADAQR